MLSDNSNKIRVVGKVNQLQGGAKGRPSLLHNKTKGGANAKGTAMKFNQFKQNKGQQRPPLPGGKGDEKPGMVKGDKPKPKYPNAKTFTDGKGVLRQIGTGKVVGDPDKTLRPMESEGLGNKKPRPNRLGRFDKLSAATTALTKKKR